MYTSHDLTVSSCLQEPLLDKSNEFRLRCDFPCNFTLWKKVCDKNVNVNSTIFSWLITLKDLLHMIVTNHLKFFLRSFTSLECWIIIRFKIQRYTLIIIFWYFSVAIIITQKWWCHLRHLKLAENYISIRNFRIDVDKN